MNKGAKLISEALLGLSIKAVVVAGKRYVIPAPTIHNIAGAAYELSQFNYPEEFKNLGDQLKTLADSKRLTAALSWFLVGDKSLAKELEKGTLTEIVEALEAAYSLIDMRDFMKAVGLSKCVAELTAKPKLK